MADFIKNNMQISIRKKDPLFALSYYKGLGYFNIQLDLFFIQIKHYFYNSNHEQFFEFWVKILDTKILTMMLGLDFNWMYLFKFHLMPSIRTLNITILFVHLKISFFWLKMKRRQKDKEMIDFIKKLTR